MLKSAQQWLFGCVLVLFVMTHAGCFLLVVGAAAGAGGVAWVQGDLEKSYDASVDRVHAAAKRALKQLKLPVTQDVKDTHGAKLQSQYSDGKDVTVQIEAITEKSSRVKIRVGVFGDQERSESIRVALERYL